jgi:hypothetical protein
MRTVASIFAFMCLFAAALVAETPMSKLRIEVKNLDDKPVDRASVVVRFAEGRSVAKLGKKVITNWEVRTNQEGIARIPSIPQGKVRIQVIAKDYQTFGATFDVKEEEQTIQIKLNPPQPQFSAHQ